MTPTPTENDSLLHSNQEHPHRYRPRSNTVEEYSSIAVAVVENETTHQPVILHDLSGPVLLNLMAEDPELLKERTDSIISVVSKATTIDQFGKEVVVVLEPSPEQAGLATIPSTIASMSKNLIGCGALSLANGIALCANTPRAVWAGNFWILVLGAIFGYFCWLIGKICHITERSTYRGIWQETVGYRGSMAVSIFNGLKAALANLAYATILADTVNSLMLSAGIHLSRGICLLLITVVAILPLCMLKSLHMLAPFSVLGTAGIVFTALAMAIRYFDGSYEEGGRYYEDIDPSLRPMFGNINHAWSPGIMPFVCMAYEAYVLHYNAARFFTELKDRSLPRFGVAVSSSFAIAGVLYMAIASFGFLTFGGNCSGYILNNYSPYDPLAFVSRLAVGLAVLLAYPIVFFGVRDSVMDISDASVSEQLAKHHGTLTIVLLSGLTFIALFVTDLGLINAVGGGLVTTPIVFLFPTIMFRRAIVKFLTDNEMVKEGLEITAATGLTVVGAIFGLTGAYLAITSALTM